MYENKIIFTLLLLSSVLGISLFIISDKIILFLISKLNNDNISCSEEDLINYFSNPNIKFYLCNEKNNAEIKEKCKEFIANNIDNKRSHLTRKGF